MGRSTRVRARPKPSARKRASRRRAVDAPGRYELLAANTRDLILFVDPVDGRVLDANRAAIEAYGYTLEELKSLAVGDLRAPAHQASVVPDLARASAEGSRFETVHRRKDGTTFPVEVSSSGAAVGGVRTLISVVRDMTAHKEVEERLRVALEAAQAGTWEWDLRTNQNFWSDGLWELYGLARDGREPSYALWRDVIYPGDRERVERIVAEAAQGGKALDVEWRVVRPDGAVRWLASRGRPIREVDGSFSRYMGIVLDVTERKQADEALAESERRYRLLADNAHDVIWTLDLGSGRFTYVSPSIQALRGLTVEEALAEPIERSLTPESLARVQAVMARIGTPDEEDPHTGVYDQPCTDGGVKHVEITTTIVRGPSGRPLEAVGVSRDATARVDAQRGLEESEGLYRSLFQLAPSGVVLLDERGAIEAFNDHACRQLGYTRDEFARLRVSDIDVVEAKPAEVLAHLARIAELGHDEFEAAHRTKAGEVRKVLVSSRAVVVGGRRRFLAVWHDVTERRRAEEAQRRSETRFRALIEKSTDLITVLDADGRRRFWSQGAIEALGWTADEVVGQAALDLVHPEDRPRIAEALRSIRARPGLATGVTARLRHKDGTWRHLEGSARNLLGDPAVEGVIVNARDVTAQRLLEEQLRQAQKLESVGRLAGGVAHDFNNLLTVILSCAASLDEALSTGRPACLEDARDIDAAAKRAAELTRQLLAFARKQAVHPVAVDLGAAVRGSEGMLRRLLGEDIDLRIDRQRELWTITADPGQLSQVIMNLAVNARDAMPSGGTLLIQTTNVAASGSGADGQGAGSGEWVQLVIRDSGMGMSDEVKAHLFEPFFTTKEQGRGTGLGLATVYGIVEQAGGHVAVHSEPGRGTAFELRFPRVHASPTARPVPPEVESLGGDERILVVEDDAHVRSVIVRALLGVGYDVVAVSHPQRALELPEEEARRLGLVITDVVMPGIDGRALARELRSRYASLRVLYLSGYTPDAIAERGAPVPKGELLGELLPKPFTAGELLAKVRAVLDAR